MQAQMPDFGDRYNVLSLIGKGAMASVYKIYDKVLDENIVEVCESGVTVMNAPYLVMKWLERIILA